MTSSVDVNRIAPLPEGAEPEKHLRSLILAGSLTKGERLPSERELALALGLSRGRAREALRALVSVGLLETRHGSGTYVADFSAQTLAAPFGAVLGVAENRISQLLDVRTVLEVEAVKWACDRHDKSTLIDLGRAIGELRVHLDDLTEFRLVEAGIHSLIHRASGNLVLVALMESLSSMITEGRLSTSTDRQLRQRTIDQHSKMLDAFRERNRVAAAEAMQDHLESIRHALPHTHKKQLADDQSTRRVQST